MRTLDILALSLLVVGPAAGETKIDFTTAQAVIPINADAVDTFRAVQKGDGEVAVWVIDTTRGMVRICALDSPGAGPTCGPWSNP